MMKFLRKYNRRILAIVVILVLVSWLIGAPLRELLSPDPSKQPVGTAFGATILSRDLHPASNDTILLDELGIPWRTPSLFPVPDARPLQILHWHLLVEEARRAGIVVPDADIDEFFQLRGIQPVQIDAIRRERSVSPRQIRAAIADYLAVLRCGAMATAVTAPTDRQIRHFIRDTKDKIDVRAILFRARNFVNNDDPLAPEALQAHFDAHKDRLPAEDEMGFGYKWPRRVRVEYIAARVAEVTPLIQVTDDEIRQYYRKNKDKPEFSRRERKMPTTTQAATTAPTAPEWVTRQMTYSEARDQIERTLKENAAIARINAAMEALAAELARPWSAAPRGQDGYKQAPPEVMAPDYLPALKERFEKQFGLPLTFRQTDLLTEETARREELIGTASTTGEGQDRLTFAEYAFRVPGFFEATTAGETALRLARYQTPDTPLINTSRGRSWDRFIFRVVDIRPPEVPQSIDEVRAKVEQDLRERRAYDVAAARAKEFYHSARNVGVDAAFEAAADLRDPRIKNAVQPVTLPNLVRRESMMVSNTNEFTAAAVAGKSTLQPPFISPLLERSALFADKCFEMVSPLFSPPDVELPPTTRPVASAPPAEASKRTVTIFAIPKHRAWAVAELTSARPVREDEFQSTAFDEARQMLTMERMVALRAMWFSPEAIQKRCQFVPAKTAEGEEVEAVPHKPQVEHPGGYF